MTGKGIANCVNRMMRDAGVKNVQAVFVPSDEECVDSEVELWVGDEHSPYAIQVGDGYLCVNKYFYGDDGLDGVEHLYEGTSMYAAVGRLVTIFCLQR